VLLPLILCCTCVIACIVLAWGTIMSLLGSH